MRLRYNSRVRNADMRPRAPTFWLVKWGVFFPAVLAYIVGGLIALLGPALIYFRMM